MNYLCVKTHLGNLASVGFKWQQTGSLSLWLLSFWILWINLFLELQVGAGVLTTTLLHLIWRKEIPSSGSNFFFFTVLFLFSWQTKDNQSWLYTLAQNTQKKEARTATFLLEKWLESTLVVYFAVVVHLRHSKCLQHRSHPEKTVRHQMKRRRERQGVSQCD